MPLTVRHIPTGAEYEVADEATFRRAYGKNPDWSIELPVEFVETVAGTATSDEDFAEALDPWKADETSAPVLPDSALGDQTLVPESQPPVPVDEPARRRRSRT